MLGTGNILLEGVETLFTILCVIGIVNALNLIDGVDGLCAALSIITLTGIIILSKLSKILISISCAIPLVFGAGYFTSVFADDNLSQIA